MVSVRTIKKIFVIEKIQKSNTGLMSKQKFETKMENVYIYLKKYKAKGTALDLVILELKGVVYDKCIKKAKLRVPAVCTQ